MRFRHYVTTGCALDGSCHGNCASAVILSLSQSVTEETGRHFGSKAMTGSELPVVFRPKVAPCRGPVSVCAMGDGTLQWAGLRAPEHVLPRLSGHPNTHLHACARGAITCYLVFSWRHISALMAPNALVTLLVSTLC